MVKKKRKRKSKNQKAKKRNKGKGKKVIGRILLFLLKSPYYIIKYSIKGVKYVARSSSKKIKEKKIEKKRKKIFPKYEKFKIIKKEKGNFSKFEKNTGGGQGKIGIILGGRGGGKTAFGVKFLENVYSKTKKKCFAIGLDKKSLPSWINSIESPEEIENNSFVLIDEGGVLFNSRKSMSSANKLLSNLILISRHKGINILFISQNSSNLEVNILRQADFLVLKPSSLLQKNFERKIVQKIYKDKEGEFNKLRKRKDTSYIYSDEFRGFISNPLPSFWKENLSKSFENN